MILGVPLVACIKSGQKSKTDSVFIVYDCKDILVKAAVVRTHNFGSYFHFGCVALLYKHCSFQNHFEHGSHHGFSQRS